MATVSSKGRKPRGSHGGFPELMQAIRTLVDPYHPELHYMRGPGPAWHAKHDRPASAETPQLPGLARLKG
jgi:hypothetical protein